MMEDNKPIKITAPYNFVPLNKYVFYPSWSEEASQDLPFSDSEDGVIDVAIHTVSPFFSRDGKKHEDSRNKENVSEYSSHIIGPDGKRHYFIPATTVKGMLREIIEIMSFGKMQEGKDYQNRFFGWRDVAKSIGSNKSTEYHNIADNGKPGWLKKEGDKYTFTPCIGEVKKILIEDVKRRFPSYSPSASIWEVNASVKTKNDSASPAYPNVNVENDTYRLVCTGKMGKKLHELLFPSDLDVPEVLTEETIVAFKTLYDNTPGFSKEKEKEEGKGHGCFLKALEQGQDIPVFKITRDGKVFLGLSKMFRIPFKYNVKEQVEKLQMSDTDKADFAETLFGHAGKEKSLKGRVMIGHAFMDGFVDDDHLETQYGILGTPKASFYPLYIKQQQSPYKTYDDHVGIAGRKLYRIHQSNEVKYKALPQPDDDDKTNMTTTFRALPEGQTFRLRIALHNTRPMEIGAVLAALTLNGTEGTFFNLGLAKGFGYGKCKVNMEDIKLSGFCHDALHYMHEFEKQMSVFTYGNIHKQWADTENITQLVNILSEHDDETVKMMCLKEYTDSKKEKKNPFTVLKESGKSIHSLLAADDCEEIKEIARNAKEREVAETARKEIEPKYQEAKRYLADIGTYDVSACDTIEAVTNVIDKLNKVLDKYNEIAGELLKKSIYPDDENEKIEDLKLKIKQWEKKKADIQNALADKEMEAKLQAGLAGEFDKSSSREFKVYFQRIEKWNKVTKENALSAEDLAVAVSKAKRLLENPDKRDLKDLKKDFNKGKPWKGMVEYLGEDTAKALYDYYMSLSNG